MSEQHLNAVPTAPVTEEVPVKKSLLKSKMLWAVAVTSLVAAAALGAKLGQEFDNSTETSTDEVVEAVEPLSD